MVPRTPTNLFGAGVTSGSRESGVTLQCLEGGSVRSLFTSLRRVQLGRGSLGRTVCYCSGGYCGTYTVVLYSVVSKVVCGYRPIGGSDEEGKSDGFFGGVGRDKLGRSLLRRDFFLLRVGGLVTCLAGLFRGNGSFRLSAGILGEGFLLRKVDGGDIDRGRYGRLFLTICGAGLVVRNVGNELGGGGIGVARVLSG